MKITFRNCGQTPAYGVSIHADSWWEPVPKPKAADIDAEPIEIPDDTPTTLAAGESITVEDEVKNASRSDWKNRNGLIHAGGMIVYRDIYGKEYTQLFDAVQTGQSLSTMRMTKSGDEPR